MEVITSLIHSFATFVGTIKSIRHRSEEFSFTKFTNFRMCFPWELYGISFLFSTELISTRIGTIFRSSEKRLCFLSTIFANDGNQISVFPRFLSILALFFSSLGSLKPLARLRKLLSSFLEIKSTFLPMSLKVFRPIKHFKIVYFIVVFVAIFVMDVHSFRNGTVVIDPNPALGVNWHIICPITIFLLPKSFTKILSFFDFTHIAQFVSKWSMRIPILEGFSQANAYHSLKEVNLYKV
jgi:hypothetical protein